MNFLIFFDLLISKTNLKIPHTRIIEIRKFDFENTLAMAVNPYKIHPHHNFIKRI
jgi:hypothetical protein